MSLDLIFYLLKLHVTLCVCSCNAIISHIKKLISYCIIFETNLNQIHISVETVIYVAVGCKSHSKQEKATAPSRCNISECIMVIASAKVTDKK